MRRRADAGVGSGLTPTESVRGTGRDATVRYEVRNRGNPPAHGIRISDPVLAPVVSTARLPERACAG